MKIRGCGRSAYRLLRQRLHDQYRPRRIAETWIKNGGTRVRISTCVLTGTFREDPPLMETMVFGGQLDGYQDRYASRRVAKAGHENTVIAVRLSIAVQRDRRARLRRMHAAYRARQA